MTHVSEERRFHLIGFFSSLFFFDQPELYLLFPFAFAAVHVNEVKDDIDDCYDE